MTISALSFSNLAYQVGELEILKSLDLVVPRKSYFALAGVNGAGKSTLIKLALDLIRPTEGSEIRIFGQCNQEPNCRQQIAYLPEKSEVKRNVTAWHYLEFIASTYHQKLDRQAVKLLAEKLDFPVDRLGSTVIKFSKGMAQKLGLLSCFMLNREMIILDEPLSGLDPSARYHFKQFLREEKTKQRTLFYSTHMLADAEEICDQFAILHQGKIKYVGTPLACMQKFDAETLEQAYMACISDKMYLERDLAQQF
jgi:ABC-2 type transport system ATP-binding protein